MKYRLKHLTESVLNSYAQVFFSKNRLFAVILFIVSFFDVYAGISGLLAVLTANGVAWFMGINRQKIIAGAYGFNSLMVGLGFGIYYQPSLAFYILLIFISIFTLFLTFVFEGVLSKYGLPYLSIPFLFGIWMVLVAARSYSGLNLSERGVYTLNEMYSLGGMSLVKVYQWFNDLALAEPLKIYFKSLSAIFFQYHLLAGILIALGLIFYSRIAFLLSLIGFLSAYYFYLIIGANISELSYSYIGFNYILLAIAVGGFFIVPSRRSLLWVFLLTPLAAVTMSSTSYLFSYFGLSIYSLPFNVIVLMFLYALKFRETNFKKLTPVTVQEFSPEKNVYRHKNFLERFGNMPYVALKLPFWGEWKVTQAFNGEITHRSDWRYAWDFEVFGHDGKPFKGTGTNPDDFYCYNKPVSAPADGEVVAVDNDVDDNRIGDMNMEKNWGNSIVIKHAELLYSQLSHLKKGSIKVKPGDHVKQGDLLAYTGNSGRSPVPHLHFQLQNTPHIGSKTIKYPLSSYILKKEKGYTLETTGYPGLDQQVSNILSDENLKKAYHFIPGEKILFTVNENGIERERQWEVKADYYNNTYLECKHTGSKAFFKNIGDVFYFTGYQGKKNTPLYFFYLSSFKVVMAFYKNLKVSDILPLNLYPNRLWLTLQDFLIPLVRFLSAKYLLTYVSGEHTPGGETVLLESETVFGILNKTVKKFRFQITVSGGNFSEMKFNTGDKKLVIKEIKEK